MIRNTLYDLKMCMNKLVEGWDTLIYQNNTDQTRILRLRISKIQFNGSDVAVILCVDSKFGQMV